MIPYLIHATILLTLSFLFYWFFLKKETFYRLNRVFLVAAFAGSLLIPLVTIPASMSFFGQRIPEVVTPTDPPTSPVPVAPAVAGNNLAVPTPPIPKTEEINQQKKENSILVVIANWDWLKALWSIYIIGAVIFLISFFIQFFVIINKKRKLESIKDGKFTLYELQDESSPFSFFHWIFINPSLYDNETYNQILDHEKIHVSQSHYLDKLLAEVAVILFWFNPFVWSYRKAITNNLEFLTDSEILTAGAEPESYQMSLLQVSVPDHALNLATSYNESFLSQRIKMMNERKSSAKSSWKYILVMPLIMVTMASLNAVTSKENSSKIVQNQEQLDNKKKINNDKRKSKGEIIENTVSIGISKTQNGEANNQPIYTLVNDTVDPTNYRTNNYTNNHTNHTYSSWNSNTIEPGYWAGTIYDNEVSLVINNSDPKGRWTWINTLNFDTNEFDKIAISQEAEMRVVRDAGKALMTGMFTDNEGQGKFEFVPSKDFNSFLKHRGIKKVSDKEMFHLFINNTDKKFVNELLKDNYKLSPDKLVEMSIHGINYSKYKSYKEIFDENGVTNTRVDRIVEMAIHGVNKEFVDGITQYDFPDFSISKLVEAKIHDVTPEIVEAIKEAGYELSLTKLIEFSIHGVLPDEIDNYSSQDNTKVDADHLVAFKIHGVTPEFIKAFADLGYDDLSGDRLVEFRIHGVTPEFVSELKSLDYNDLSPSRLVEFVIHGVSTNFVSELNELGYTDIRPSRLVEFRIHGVTTKFIEEMAAVGYTDVRPSRLVEARIHGVTPYFIKEFQKAGVGDIPLSKYIEYSIHNIDPKDLR